MPAEQLLSCPLCSTSLKPSSLEAHLRFELLLPAFRCLLCPQSFCSEEDALDHFRGEGARHPGQEPRLIQPPTDKAQKERLGELLRLARGGQEAVQKRLCLCGSCQLICQEDRKVQGELLLPGDRSEPLDQHIFSQPSRDLPTGHENELEDSESIEEIIVSDLPVAVDEETGGAKEEPAIEEEAPVPMEVKPTLANLRPNIASDSKVACLLCGLGIARNNFHGHARSSHVPGGSFQCLLCEHSTKTKNGLAYHQKSQHDRELTSETFTCSVPNETVREWIKLCFGDTKDQIVGYVKTRCRPCDRSVRKIDVKEHIAAAHLKKPLYECKICDYKILHFSPTDMKKHVKRKHKLEPGPETIDSSGLETYAPIIQAVIPQLFDN